VSFRRASHHASARLRVVAACLVVVIAVAGLLGVSHLDLAEAPVAFTLLPPTSVPTCAFGRAAVPVAGATPPAEPRGPPLSPDSLS
jgi:hypothetical protein